MTERDDHPVDFLPELALGVLADDAALEIRAHLRGCDSCSAEYEEMERVARLLPLAAEDREPAPSIKDGLMERIAAEPRRIGPLGTVVRPRWQWFGAAAAAGLALLAAGVGAGWLRGQDDEGDLEDRIVQQQSLVDAVADGTLKEIPGEGTGGATAVLLAAPGSGDAFVRITNAPALDEGKRYQAWYIRGETPVPGEVYVDARGIWLHVDDGRLADYDTIAFTVEDKDGASAPSQTPFMFISTEQIVRAR